MTGAEVFQLAAAVFNAAVIVALPVLDRRGAKREREAIARQEARRAREDGWEDEFGPIPTEFVTVDLEWTPEQRRRAAVLNALNEVREKGVTGKVSRKGEA